MPPAAKRTIYLRQSNSCVVATIIAVPDPRPDAAELLALFVQRVVTMLHVDTIETVAAFDLSLTQARILFALHHHGTPVPISQIATGLGSSVAATERNIEHLVRLGLVSRVEDPHDRRVKLISLTPAGLDLIARRVEQNRRTLRAFVERLPETDAERLAAALEPILAGTALPPAHKESHDR